MKSKINTELAKRLLDVRLDRVTQRKTGVVRLTVIWSFYLCPDRVESPSGQNMMIRAKFHTLPSSTPSPITIHHDHHIVIVVHIHLTSHNYSTYVPQSPHFQTRQTTAVSTSHHHHHQCLPFRTILFVVSTPTPIMNPPSRSLIIGDVNGLNVRIINWTIVDCSKS